MVLFFPFQSLNILFPFFVALARISSTVLKRGGEGRHPWLVTDFSEKASSYSWFMKLALGFCRSFVSS